MTKLLSYAEIAQGLGVSVESVRRYAHNDPDFPTKIIEEKRRSPQFRSEDVEEYLRAKRSRSHGRAGRPPRIEDAADRVAAGKETGARIRELIDAPDAPVGDVRALAGLLGLEAPALRYRLRGHTRWRCGELAAVARVFRVTVPELTGGRVPA